MKKTDIIPYIDELHSKFKVKEIGDQLEFDPYRLGYDGKGEIVIPQYFKDKFIRDSISLRSTKVVGSGNIESEIAYYIQRENGEPGITTAFNDL